MNLNPNQYDDDKKHDGIPSIEPEENQISDGQEENALSDDGALFTESSSEFDESRFNDEAYNREIPQDLSQRTKNNLGKVAAFAGFGVATIAIVVGAMTFFGGERKMKDDVVETSESIGNTAPKDFSKDLPPLAFDEGAASEVAMASEPVMASQPMATETVVVQEGGEAPPPVESPMDRKKRGNVLLTDGGNSSAKSEGNKEGEPVDASILQVNDGGGASGGSGGGGGSLSSRLNSTAFPEGRAARRGDRSLLLNRGTMLPCVLVTKIVTTYPSITKCQVTKDVYSSNGKALLLERGSYVMGEQQSALVQGQARVFVLWSSVETPKGVVVNIDSGGTDTLGAAGHPARVNNHFFKRFGGAIMLSMVDDLSDALGRKISSSNNGNRTITFENSADNAQEMAAKALESTINIPPTGYVNQGSMLNIVVARDVSFNNVYELLNRSDMNYY